MFHRDDAFWRRRSASQCAVRPDGIVVNTPLFNQDLDFAKVVEDFPVQQFVAEPGVEAFALSM